MGGWGIEGFEFWEGIGGGVLRDWGIVAQAGLRFGFLRMSTIKKCPNTLRSDHMDLRNSREKLGWWVVESKVVAQ